MHAASFSPRNRHRLRPGTTLRLRYATLMGRPSQGSPASFGTPRVYERAMKPSDSNKRDGHAGEPSPRDDGAEVPAQPFPDAEDNFGLTPKPKAKLKRVDPLLGVDLGGVQITKLIGEGGMGRVYEARQARPDRIVAVKIVRHGITNEKTLRRFEREAEFLGKLQHPAIAQIYAVGTYESDLGDVPFFVMEHVPNARPITNFVHDQGLDLTARLRLFKQVCDAVAHGHDRGIVHRDLKPGNVLISADGTPKVIDFGVARSTDSDLTLTKLKTDTGALVGTLQYMSPEQFGDSAESLDGRADVYSMGVVLYELVSGSLPYEIRKKAMHEASRIVCEEIPPTLRSRDRACPRDVSLIAERCLQKDRRYRYHNAGELAADLEKFLGGRPISVGPTSGLAGLLRKVLRLAGKSHFWLAGLLVTTAFALGALALRDRGARPADPGQGLAASIGGGLSSKSPAEEFKGRLTPAWAETALSVSRGECYRVWVYGVFSGGQGLFGADGTASLGTHSRLGPRNLTPKTQAEAFVGGFPRLAVMARIGQEQRPIYVGKELAFIAPSTGRLAFRLNAAEGDDSQAGGDVTIGIERVRVPEFRGPDGKTSIRARVRGEEYLVFAPEGLRWERSGLPESGTEYPVVINNIAWWPEWLSPTASAVLKTTDFAWAAPAGGFSGPLPNVISGESGSPTGSLQAVEIGSGVLALRLKNISASGGEVAGDFARPKRTDE
jgi:tRNA A-37 threonylcarbamoyl transferase component Bud32